MKYVGGRKETEINEWKEYWMGQGGQRRITDIKVVGDVARPHFVEINSAFLKEGYSE